MLFGNFFLLFANFSVDEVAPLMWWIIVHSSCLSFSHGVFVDQVDQVDQVLFG